MKVAYIVGPYRAGSGRAVIDNVRAAERTAIKYWRMGYAVICPHTNTAFFDGVCPDETWLIGDVEIMKRCDVVIVMQDWSSSQGSINEVAIAKKEKKELIFE